MNPCCGNLTRGVAILGDKLFLAALDAQMIAINAKTGKELWKTAGRRLQAAIRHDRRSARGQG